MIPKPGSNITASDSPPTGSLRNEPGGLVRPFTLKRCARLLALALVVAMLWGVIFDRWRPSDWSTPSSYRIDAWYYMGLIQHAKNGDLLPVGYFYSKLVGAPFVGNLNDRPDSERMMLYLAGVISRGIGIMATVNLMVVCAHILAALVFYIAARLWRVARLFAWSLSIAYTFIPYALAVQNYQLSYIFFGLLPLQLYSCWYLSSAPSLKWQNSRFKLAVLVGLLSGFLQIYWVVGFLLLFILALTRRILSRKPHFLKALIPAGLACFVTATALSSTLIYQYTHGQNPKAVTRKFAEVETRALKPMNMVLPARGQGFRLFNSVGLRYGEGKGIPLVDEKAPYLGALGVAGLIILLTRGFLRAVVRKSIPLPLLVVLGFIAYASIGGLNSLWALFLESYLIRTTSRYSVVIASVCLLCLAFSLSYWTRKWSHAARVILSLALVSLALVDQAGPTLWDLLQRHGVAQISRAVESDKLLAAKLEEDLPEGSMVFMLPVTSFPEYELAKIWELGWADYSLLRPIIHSSKLRFSYGSVKGRPEADWQENMTGLPATELIANLESYGFSGLLIHRHGYKDKAEALIKELADTGHAPTFEHDDEVAFL